MSTGTERATAAAAAASLRAVLAAIDAGDLDATAQQHAYLSGSADALDPGHSVHAPTSTEREQQSVSLPSH